MVGALFTRLSCITYYTPRVGKLKRPYVMRCSGSLFRMLRRHMSSASTNNLKVPARRDAIPRPSASLVIVNDRNEVLLVHRNPQAKSFGGVHVSTLILLYS